LPQPAPDCRVLFIGAHGLNEDEHSRTLNDTWAAFHGYSEHHGGYGGEKEMLPYPNLSARKFINAVRSDVENPQMSSFPAINQGATMIDAAVRKYLRQCPSGGGVVLAGYSEGAWIIDEFLRKYYGLAAVVKGVQLYGDPLYEKSDAGDLGLARILGFASNFPDPYPDSTLAGGHVVNSRCVERDPICGGNFHAARSHRGYWAQLKSAADCARDLKFCKSHTESYAGYVTKQGGEFLAAKAFVPD